MLNVPAGLRPRSSSPMDGPPARGLSRADARPASESVKETVAAAEGQEFTISGLAPSQAQKRLALGVFIVLLTGLALPGFGSLVPIGSVVPIGGFGSIPLAQLPAFVPAYATAMATIDLLTSVLLFAQFSIVRAKALLVISSGYLFTGLMAVPWMLTFPGAFAPTGLLGAGLHTTSWVYILWHGGFPLVVLAYALLKDQDHPANDVWSRSIAIAILSSVAVTVATVVGIIIFVTAGHELLPPVNDPTRGNYIQQIYLRIDLLLAAVALLALWLRRRSVLDLWLMIVMCAFVIELFVNAPRFSLGWYSARFYGFISGSIVLVVLLYEATTLYATTLRALLAERRERNARLMTWDAVSASIAHEIKQPLAAVITNTQSGQRWLRRPQPDIREAEEAFTQIERDGRRIDEIIDKTRAIYRSGKASSAPLDSNKLITASLALMGAELQTRGVSVCTELTEQLPLVRGDQVQLQQVLVNLITNAIDAMAASDAGERVLWVRSSNEAVNSVSISVEDNGKGFEPQEMELIFNPLFTTKTQGMGMGLTICRSIVEAHGGRLWATPNRPRGAVFQFSLPAIAS
jgi:signal transduction histidine kinase